jgi:hypothetical protein
MLLIFSSLPDDFLVRFFVGFGALLTLICLIRFLEWSQKSYTLVYALRVAIPVCVNYIMGVGPVFFAYALFGVAVFSPSVPKFQNVFQALITLFGVMNGDALIETFQECYIVSEPIATIYLLTFLMFFILVVLNLFVAIIEEAYHLARRRLETATSQPPDPLANPAPASPVLPAASPPIPTAPLTAPM